MANGVIMAEAITTATPTYGPAIGLQVDSLATPFGGGAAAKSKKFIPLEIVLTNTADTSTATVIIQQSENIAFSGSPETLATLSFTSQTGPQTKKGLVKLTRRYIRVGVTAISSASITGYLLQREN
jgi:hypothetical protein